MKSKNSNSIKIRAKNRAQATAKFIKDTITTTQWQSVQQINNFLSLDDFTNLISHSNNLIIIQIPIL
ncbi:hypothetical protein RIR_jg32095.t1 [Rhizophagus irregularis DAOM 181602=DAOM 197198]|nr:hypothetical protein RIR_jg32095.t1 [Rhizophagus irregularis DAOM 181602=DAOM 197198]